MDFMRRVRTVALATCRELPHLDSDEEHLVRALKARDILPVIAPWDAGDDVFQAAPLTVIRSTWDYTARVDEFVEWAARIEARGRILNKASVVRWNTHKRYLSELAQEGIAVVPTAQLKKGSAVDVAALLRERGWTKGAVVKPAVSAGSKDTVRVHGLDVDEAQALMEAQLPSRDMMVQPFVDGVKDGELSLIYIDGAYSHAVNKAPKAGDFRSQPEFGSRVEKVEPTREQRASADDILRTVGGGLLYARVDMVPGDDGRPWLMELEVVEPCLYLGWDDGAGDRLAAAIERALHVSKP